MSKTLKTPKHKRIAVYVSEADYNILRSQLALTPYRNVSRWMREQIKKFILKG